MKFKCRFEFIKSSTSGAEQRSVESEFIVDFMGNGFWIDEEFKLTGSHEGIYFIPASQIYIIEKLPT